MIISEDEAVYCGLSTHHALVYYFPLCSLPELPLLFVQGHQQNCIWNILATSLTLIEKRHLLLLSSNL